MRSRALVVAALIVGAAALVGCSGAEDERDDAGLTVSMGAGADAALEAGTTPALAGDAGSSVTPDASPGAPRSDGGATPQPGTDAGTNRMDAGEPAPDAAQQPVRDAGPDASDAANPKPDASQDASTPPDPTKKFVGNIISSQWPVKPVFDRYWDQVTPENEGKWSSVEAQRDRMDWSKLDAIYNHAKAHNQIFKQHTFVWGSQQPGWIGGLSASEQREEVEEWIRLFCERYPDTPIIDVVNEPPPHTTPPYMNAIGGAGQSGYDWIVQSFKWARQYCPKAILILNDYNNIEWENDVNHFIDIAKRVKAAGAPIDAVGAQAHDAHKRPTATVKQYLDRLAAETGLPVYITEYDIGEPDDTKQKQVMESQFPLFYTHASVKGITLWGYILGQTWRNDERTGLMTDSGMERPALTWLMDYLKR
jgi:endo-1,4-beta-xylanase